MKATLRLDKGRASRPADCALITASEFCRLAGIAYETYRRNSQKGLMPRSLPGGIPKEEAQKWLQAKADTASEAAARLRQPTASEAAVQLESEGAGRPDEKGAPE